MTKIQFTVSKPDLQTKSVNTRTHQVQSNPDRNMALYIEKGATPPQKMAFRKNVIAWYGYLHVCY